MTFWYEGSEILEGVVCHCIHTVFRLISVIYAKRKLKEEENGNMDPSVCIVVAPLLVQFFVVQCNLQFALCTLCFVLCALHIALCTLHFALYILQFVLCDFHFVQCTLHFALCTVHSALCTGKQLGAQTSLHQLEFHQSQDYITIFPLFPSLLVTLSSLFICIRSLPLLSSVVKKGAWTDVLVFAILY